MSRREDVAKAALDVGMLRTYIGLWEASTSELIYLYDAAFKAGAEAERAACAKVCDAEAAPYLSDMKVIARNCAAAIRLRGDT